MKKSGRRLSQLTRRKRSRTGTTLVEMALVLSVFFVLVSGIVEFGRVMMVNQVLADGTRRGARTSAFDGASNSSVTEAVRSFIGNAAGVNPNDVDVTITVIPAPGNPDPGGEIANAEIGDLVSVQARVPIDKVTWTPATYLSGHHLTAFASMRHE